MAERYWFKKHKGEYGWVPSSWQGWLVMLVYLVTVGYSFIEIDLRSHSVSDTLINFIPRVLMLSALLIIIAYLKGEPTAKPSPEKSE